MESALDVLSRAATMMQDNANESRLNSKELPTSAWRRERRLRAGEYHHPHYNQSSSVSSATASPPPVAHVQPSLISTESVSNTNKPIQSNAHKISIMMAAATTSSMRPSSEPINGLSPPSPPEHSVFDGHIRLGQIAHSHVLQHLNLIQSDDAPLDMSVGNLNQRNSPPPYREPLPGSQFASSLARPSVITQAPPKRDIKDYSFVANRENDNRSCESIDEHFRRSLGNDYYTFFSKRSTDSQSTKAPSPQSQNLQPQRVRVRSPSPTLPLSSGTPSLSPHSALIQSELIPSPTYSVGTGNHQQRSQQMHQNPSVVTTNEKNVLSPAVIPVEMKLSRGSSSPPLPLIVRPIMQPKHHPVGLQKSSSLVAVTSLTLPASIPGIKLGSTTQTLYSTAGSKTVSSSPSNQHQQPSAVAKTLLRCASVDHSPSSSPRHMTSAANVAVSNSSPNLRIKTEPRLQNVKSNDSTYPVSPTSNTNPTISSNSTSGLSNTSSPAPSSPITSSWKSLTNSGNTSADVLASVDDHFAKALGDTWKKLKGNKEIRK